MGKAVPKNIKLRAAVLMEKYPDSFSNDFEKNKEFIVSLELPFPKSTINLITGYITRKNKAS